jgi:hypothetical protein
MLKTQNRKFVVTLYKLSAQLNIALITDFSSLNNLINYITQIYEHSNQSTDTLFHTQRDH